MMWVTLVCGLCLATAVLSSSLLDPGELAQFLNEDEFEDYLDKWLKVKQQKWTKDVSLNEKNATGCSFKVNGDISEPQPVYLRSGNYITPTGTTGLINLASGENVYIACTGSKRTISYPNSNVTVSTANATCIKDIFVYGDEWLDGVANFTEILCSSNPKSDAELTEETCFNNNTVIRYGYNIDEVFYPLYHSCFDQSRLETIYSRYELNPANAVQQTGVSRPSWSASTFYPGVDVDDFYTKDTQQQTIAKLVGEELANIYVTSTQYLARGHLAAKTDFVLASAQRATFFFSNAAPQWQSINGGNWNWLEQSVRDRIGEANYHTRVYTGTFGVAQLRDQEGAHHDLYLYYDENNNPQIPSPMYYYKVVYEPNLRIGTVFISINNPYLTEEEAEALTFCPDICRDNPDFSWISWKPQNILYGWSFCCEVDEFRKTVPHLPEFQVDGTLA